jgi:hypothetical protein
MLGVLEKGRALGGVVGELVAEHTEGAWRVSEGTGDLGGRKLLDEVSAQGLILALEGIFGSEEETGVGRMC